MVVMILLLWFHATEYSSFYLNLFCLDEYDIIIYIMLGYTIINMYVFVSLYKLFAITLVQL